MYWVVRVGISTVFFIVFVVIGSETADRFLHRAHTNPGTQFTMNYRLFVPDGYDSTQAYPIVFYLHGYGDCNEENTKQLTKNEGATMWARESTQQEYPSFVLAPCLPKGSGIWPPSHWSFGNYHQDTLPISSRLRDALSILDLTIEQYRIDTNRVYIMGLSMGAGGTWDALTRFPNRFAAAIPVSGYGDPDKMHLITHIPIWTFHGSADGIISVETTRELVRELESAGGEPTYTEYAGARHGIWVEEPHNALTEEGLVEWLFSHSKPSTSAKLKRNPGKGNGKSRRHGALEYRFYDGPGKTMRGTGVYDLLGVEISEVFSAGGRLAPGIYINRSVDR